MSKKPTPKENKKYTAEFKGEAIKLAERLSVAEAAEKLGIYASQIYSWRSVRIPDQPDHPLRLKMITFGELSQTVITLSQ